MSSTSSSFCSVFLCQRRKYVFVPGAHGLIVRTLTLGYCRNLLIVLFLNDHFPRGVFTHLTL